MPFENGTNMAYQGEMFGLNQDEGYKWTPIGQVIDHINKDVGIVTEHPFPESWPGLDPRFAEAWKKDAKDYKMSWNEKFGRITSLKTKKFTNYQVKAMVVPFLQKMEQMNGSGKVLYKEREDHKSYDLTLALDETIVPSDGNALYLGYKLSTRHDGNGCLNAEWWTIRKVCVNGNLWGECATANGHDAKISILHTGKEDLRAAQMEAYIGDVEYAGKTIKSIVDQAIATKFEYNRERARALMHDYFKLADKFGAGVVIDYETTKDNRDNWYGLIQSATKTARTMYKNNYKMELSIQNKVQEMFSRPGWLPELKPIAAKVA